MVDEADGLALHGADGPAPAEEVDLVIVIGAAPGLSRLKTKRAGELIPGPVKVDERPA